MSHEIFGERFYGTREPAWHGLGQVFKKALKPSVAVRKVGIDYTVGTYPMLADVGKHSVPTGKVAIMRSPTADDKEWRYFGIASENYEVVQNVDLADIMDTLAEVWELSAMGAVENGKTVFMVLNTGGLEVRGDPVNGYFALVDTKDGGTATKLVFTPVRMVCKNTLVTGLRAATVSINVAHIRGAKDQLAARVGLIKKARAAIDDTTKVFRQLAGAKLTQKQADAVFSQVYPIPRTPESAALVDWSQEDLGDLLFRGVQDQMYAFNYYTQQAQQLQAGAATCYEKLNDEYPKLAGTAWHAYNAVVELADFREGGAKPQASSLFGSRAREKSKAFKLCSSFIKQEAG